jgi:hypothetical protein
MELIVFGAQSQNRFTRTDNSTSPLISGVLGYFLNFKPGFLAPYFTRAVGPGSDNNTGFIGLRLS